MHATAGAVVVTIEIRAMASICLLVQDPSLQHSLEQLFTRAGFRPSTFTAAEALLQILSASRPHCVVAEHLSPAEETITLVKAIHRHHPALPIILLATDDDVTTAVKAIQAGAFDFVQKPIVDRLLIESVKTAIESEH